MINKIFSSLKIVTLAIVLSFGLSYVYAWTAPTQSPPAGNVSAPINTSAAAQTKAGGLTVGGLTTTSALNMGTNNIVAGGANSTYGAMTIQGAKNTYSGLNFKDLNGNNSGTLMMHPSYSGFFNATDNNWRWYVSNAGASFQSGSASASDFCTTAGTCLSAAGSGVGVAVYLCPVVADSTYGRYRVWPGSPSACAGQLTTHTTCVTLTPAQTWNCAFAGHLTP